MSAAARHEHHAGESRIGARRFPAHLSRRGECAIPMAAGEKPGCCRQRKCNGLQDKREICTQSRIPSAMVTQHRAIAHHISDDKLVHWGWEPSGRAPAPTRPNSWRPSSTMAGGRRALPKEVRLREWNVWISLGLSDGRASLSASTIAANSLAIF